MRYADHPGDERFARTTPPAQRLTVTLWLTGMLVMLAAIGVHAFSGTGAATNVRGTVILDGKPLGGVSIAVDGLTACRTTSNPLGAFELRGVPVGCVTLIAERGALRCGYPVRTRPEPTVDLGLLPMHRWEPLPGMDSHGDERELRNLVIIRGSR